MPLESWLRFGATLGNSCHVQWGQGLWGERGDLAGTDSGAHLPWCCLAGMAEGLLPKVSPSATQEAFDGALNLWLLQL